MDLLLSIVALFLSVVTIALVLAVLRLRRGLSQMEARLAAITRRVYHLESGPAPIPEPASAQAPTPVPSAPPVPELASTERMETGKP